jgi:hypothetical protein
MNDNVLLVDYENVGKIDLSAIPAGVRVPFFFGASQKSVPTEFLKAALKLGERFLPIDIEGHGKNALDFHIAFYLGEYLARSPQARCVILSRDKGFDPLIRHLAGRGFLVQRANTLGEAFARRTRGSLTDEGPDSMSLSERALKWLGTMAKSKRPRKRKGLVAHLHSHFSKKVSEAELQRVVDRLIAAKKLSDSNGTIAYHF